MSADEVPQYKLTHLLFPIFEMTVSVNGHLQTFQVLPSAYIDAIEDDDVDSLNYVALWRYFEDNLTRYLIGVADDLGPVDVDNLRLVALTIKVLTGPDGIEEVLDCDECMDSYETAFRLISGDSDEDEDEDD